MEAARTEVAQLPAQDEAVAAEPSKKMSSKYGHLSEGYVTSKMNEVVNKIKRNRNRKKLAKASKRKNRK